MNLATQVELARPRSATDHGRFRLLVTTIAIAGAFLLAAWRIKRLGFDANYNQTQNYSSYIAEQGIRGGVAIATLLVAVASCLLAYQALRLGTAARERRLAAFRLAGATRRQVRGLGAVEAGIAGLAGGILAGPLYLLLTLAIQALPRTARMLPPGNAVDLATWPIVAVVLTVLAAAAGALLGRGVMAAPRERSPRASKVAPAAVAVAAAFAVIALPHLFSSGRSDFSLLVPTGVSLTLVCLALPILLVAWRGNRLARSGNPLKVLAGGRLLRTVRPLGRTLGLLIFCSAALGFVAAMVVELDQTRDGGSSADGFQLTGFAFATGAALFIGAIAVVALLAGTADDLLDQRRQLAALNVLGVGEAQLRASVRHQLTACITPAVTAGLAIGALLHANFMVGLQYPPDKPSALPPLIGVVVVGAGLGWLLAAGAAQLLRAQVREATAAGNLRAT